MGKLNNLKSMERVIFTLEMVVNTRVSLEMA